MATKFSRKNLLNEVQCNDEVQGHAGVNWSQSGVKLLRNTLWQPNLEGRTPDWKEYIAGVKGHVGSAGVSWGQPEVKSLKCLIATKCGQCRFRAYDAYRYSSWSSTFSLGQSSAVSLVELYCKTSTYCFSLIENNWYNKFSFKANIALIRLGGGWFTCVVYYFQVHHLLRG